MSASPTDVILGSVALITATTVIKNVRAPAPPKGGFNQPTMPKPNPFKPVLFGFGLAAALLAIAIVAPGFAKGLAYLGLVGAFVLNGPTLFALIGSFGGK